MQAAIIEITVIMNPIKDNGLSFLILYFFIFTSPIYKQLMYFRNISIC